MVLGLGLPVGEELPGVVLGPGLLVVETLLALPAPEVVLVQEITEGRSVMPPILQIWLA